MDEKLRTFYELYERRKSIRDFLDRPVEDDKLARLLEVLRRAQSAANCQPWHFIVIRGEDRAAINEVFYREGFKRAPVIIAACAEPAKAWTRRCDGRNYAWVDTTIAVTEMIGAATAEGLGTCWIASFDVERVKAVLAIPDDIDVVGLIAVGHPPQPLRKEEKDRKALDEIIHWGRWRR
ncbi:MAG TPA: nitroreductase [Deltaproteobacteria bacterium]|nr:nitroreductase [Deltaproteobacteria bacterium]